MWTIINRPCTIILFTLSISYFSEVVASLRPITNRSFCSLQNKERTQQWGNKIDDVAMVSIRGGSSVIDRNSDDSSDGEFDVGPVKKSSSNAIILIAANVIALCSKVIFGVVFALLRAIDVAISTLKEGRHDKQNIAKKVIVILFRMVRAFLNFNGSPRSSDSTITDLEESSLVNFGNYLETAYGISGSTSRDNGTEECETNIVHGGSLSEALGLARSQARLLVAFIPASKPFQKNKKRSYDQITIEGLLSSQVAKIARRKSLKKEGMGSFVLWSTTPGSSEAVAAMKRLKAKKTNGSKKNGAGGSPVLLVAYPAQVVSSSGQSKLSGKLLAQHHCNPPPSPESMSAWLNALRKRHAKQYALMQHDLQEAEILTERTQGYKNSILEDGVRVKQEQLEEEQRLAKERVEKERIVYITKRRKDLLESLPEEPNKNTNVITVALRFADGRTGERRFLDETKVDMVMNWVDAIFEVERELITLTTMTGQKSFSFGEDENLTLKQTGLGRMVGLRVSQKIQEDLSTAE